MTTFTKQEAADLRAMIDAAAGHIDEYVGPYTRAKRAKGYVREAWDQWTRADATVKRIEAAAQ